MPMMSKPAMRSVVKDMGESSSLEKVLYMTIETVSWTHCSGPSDTNHIANMIIANIGLADSLENTGLMSTRLSLVESDSDGHYKTYTPG